MTFSSPHVIKQFFWITRINSRALVSLGLSLLTDFLEEEEGVDPEETINSSNRPVKRTIHTSPPNQMSRTTASATFPKPDSLDRGSKSHVLQRGRQYIHFTEQDESKGTREENSLLHMVNDDIPETRYLGQAKGSAGALESQSGAPNDQASDEDGDIRTLPFIHRGRSLAWLLPDPGLTRKNKYGTETADPPVKRRSPIRLPRKSPLYVLANRILNNAGKSIVWTSVEKENNTNRLYITRPRPPSHRAEGIPKQPVEVFPGVFLYHSRKHLVDFSSKWKSLKTQSTTSLPWPNFKQMDQKTSTQTSLLKNRRTSFPTEPGPHYRGNPTTFISDPNSLPPLSSENRDHPGLNSSEMSQPPELEATKISEMLEGSDMVQQSRGFEDEEMSEYSYEEAELRPHLTEEAINWQRTFSVNPVDFELLRSDWNDLRCNVSGNLQLAENEAVDVISQYMEKLNERNGGLVCTGDRMCLLNVK